jgi:hypothetical protein
MRLNNLNIKSFLYLLVASFVLCAACEPTFKPADEPVEQSPVLTLSTQEISVSPEGEELSISYSLENAKEGVELSAECQAAWISNIAIDTEKITLQVAENEDAEREELLVLIFHTHRSSFLEKLKRKDSRKCSAAIPITLLFYRISPPKSTLGIWRNRQKSEAMKKRGENGKICIANQKGRSLQMPRIFTKEEAYERIYTSCLGFQRNDPQ